MFYIFISLFGLCVGSFINVVVLRTPKKMSFLRGRSQCPQCKKQLCWYELIPLLSFLFLRGKCSKCKTKISWQYPIVELVSGLLFLFIGFYFIQITQLSIYNIGFFSVFELLFYVFNFLILLYIASIFLFIFIYDLKYYIILNKVVYSSIVVILLTLIINNYYFKNSFIFPSLYSGLVGAVVGGSFFFSLIFISQGRWMGMGDGKLSILIGLILGYERLLCALFLAFVGGAIFGIILILAGKKKMQSKLPFGTFLSLATLASLLYGDKLISWFLNLIYFY